MVPPDIKETSPIELLTLLVTSVFTPCMGWLFRVGSQLGKKITLLESRFNQRMKDLDELQSTAKTSDIRLVRVEDAIVEMKAASVKMDTQYALILSELKQLTRVATLVDSLNTTLAHIVPRSEVEARLNNAEQRIHMVELDVRSARQT